MPELRKDPLVDRWVIIAPERADRPHAWLKLREEPDDGSCPFCRGNEAMTPPDLLTLRAPASGGWNVRVVPNRFPALRTELQPVRSPRGAYDLLGGTGAHEVIIEAPDHRTPLGRMPRAQVELVLQAWASRIQDLSRDQRLRAAIIFKNEGAPAGATLSHPHSQLIALPLVPPELQADLAAAHAHYARKERCIWCDLLAQELLERTRLVAENERFVALCPYASRSPFEVQLFPKQHRSAFERSWAEELSQAAELLRTVLGKLDVALEHPALNLFLQTQPLRDPDSPSYHWRLTVKPMLTMVAGFEWASGCYINPTPPEEAAGFLRQTEV